MDEPLAAGAVSPLGDIRPRYGQIWQIWQRYGQIWPDMADMADIWPDMAGDGLDSRLAHQLSCFIYCPIPFG